jgi:thiamine-monophosphate kinase
MSPTQSVADLGEHELIARLERRFGPPPPWVTLGIGDDAAVVAPVRGEEVVVTTDSLVEGVHFLPADASAPDAERQARAGALGHKALAVSLSDLAAMGAAPRAALLSLAIRSDWPVAEFDALIDGFAALAALTRTPLVGGNITRSPGPLVLDVTAIGSALARKILRRSAGRAGDELYVTGRLGAAAAGVAVLADPAAESLGRETSFAECIGRHERPTPRVRCGLMAGRARVASAAIDLSDGLSDAVRQIARASGVGAVVEADAVPVHPGASAWAARQGIDAIDLALSGGEDYELLFAVPRRRRRAFLAIANRWHGLPVTAVGRLSAEAGAWLIRDGRREPLPSGFVHF